MDISLTDISSKLGSTSVRSPVAGISKSPDRQYETSLFQIMDSIPSSRSSPSTEKRKIFVEETTLSIRTKPRKGKPGEKPVREADVDTNLSSSSARGTSSGTSAASSPSNLLKSNADSYPSYSRRSTIRDVKPDKENRRTEGSDGRVSRKRQMFSRSRSSMHDSSFDTDNRSYTPLENVSYRERIRDRFNTLKERAVESLSRPQSRSQSRLKMLMTRQGGGGKLEDIFKKEEDALNAAIERHKSSRQMWSHSYEEAINLNTYEESINFFTQTNGDEFISQRQRAATDEEVPSNTVTENGSNGKVLTSELLGLKDDWDLCEFRSPELTDMSKDEKHLFCPSTNPVLLEEKLESGLSPRYLEEEGIYTGNKTKLSKRIKNKIEQRLLMTPEGRKWFGANGELISRINPVVPVRMKPCAADGGHINASLIPTYSHATVSDHGNRCIDITGNMNYVLDIDISLIQFSHHPLFSREHVLAQRLKELFSKYKRRNELNNLSRYNGRLEALRRSRDNVLSSAKESGDNRHFDDVLQRYEDDIKEVRRIRNLEGQIDKELTSKILLTWKDLKQLREAQGYRNTDIRLNVKKTVSKTAAEEKDIWDSKIRQEAREIYDEMKKQYDKEFSDYKARHDEWARLKRMQGKGPRQEAGDGEASESDGEDNDDMPKEPEPPRTIVLSEIREEVTETFKKCFRQPGEPEIELTIDQMESQEHNTCSNKEQMRRSAARRLNIFLKLFYNGKEVCRSKSQPLSQQFYVVISQRFAIRILEWPESFMIEIHEDSGSFSKNSVISGIYLPFPSCFTTVENSDTQKHEFSSTASVSYSHTGVGSGSSVIPYPDGSECNNRATCLFTSGTVVYRIGWVENQGQILAPPERYWTNRREELDASFAEILALEGPCDAAKLKEWASKSKLDPNDPDNSFFFHYLQQIKDSGSLEILHFRLDPLMSAFDFCSESDIVNNARFRLLSLRDLDEPEFRCLKMIPLNEKQIHKDIFRAYEKRMSAPQHSLEIVTLDPLDGHRAWGRKYLELVQQKVLKECRLAKQHKRFQELVSEESVPSLGTLGLTFMRWLRPKRPLRPIRKERKRVTPQNLMGQDVKIIVNVVRAFEVPVRKDMDSLSATGASSSGGDLFSLTSVRPFVEVSFQGVKARTTAADGANPTWNQDLQIPLSVKNRDLSHANIQAIKDILYLHLFDEIVVDLIDDEQERETNIHQRFERHWLASMEIPFSTLYFNSRIEGTFKLYSPPVLLGYEREAHRRQFTCPVGQENFLPQRDATYISLFVTVQPPLNPPDLLKERLESNETSSLEKHLEGWEREVTDMCQHRKVKSLVTDITGKTVCITRFIKPLAPPALLGEDNKMTPQVAARYVAMIPSIAGSVFFPGLFDIWLTADQILRLLSGDSEDHAILLCCYFLQLGLKSYVLLGSGIPHGSTAYVLVKEDVNKSSEYYVWDATNGQKYNINDSFCPLQKIYCIFNDQNIWANIQPEEMPRRTRFDLTKRTDWLPAFGKTFSAPSGSVQPDSLDYRTTSRQAVEFLQDKIEKRLRDNIMKWRRTKRTRWNRYCSGTLRKLLPKLEKSVWNTEESQTPDHALELQHIMASHKMCGFPINMTYTDIDAIVEAVKATGVHCNENSEVEFALSVYIHSYPNDVLSIWIYVASLIRRR